MDFIQKVITPEEAQALLLKNKINRRIQEPRVKEKVDAIKSGHWTESNDAICVSRDGFLLNGQHRLTAIARAGIPVLVTMAYNAPDDIVIDRGKERSPVDSLYMRGMISRNMASSNVAATVNRYLAIKYPKRYTPIQEYDRGVFINEHEKEITDTLSACKHGGSGNKLCRKAGVQAAILGALISGVDLDTVRRFTKAVNTGFVDDACDSAAIVLRNWIMTNPVTGAQAADKMALITQTALKDFVNRVPRKRAYTVLESVYIKQEDAA